MQVGMSPPDEVIHELIIVFASLENRRNNGSLFVVTSKPDLGSLI